MIQTAEQIAEVLKEIQSRIPKLLLANALYETELTPTIKMVVDKALESPTFPEEKKVKLRALKGSGEFNKKVTANNPKVQKQIDNFVSREINKAIKSGRLPPRSKIGDVDFIKKMYKLMQNK